MTRLGPRTTQHGPLRFDPLNIVLHDFSGHPFQVQLSRELANRGHRVSHLWCPSYVSGKGAVTVKTTDAPGFSSEGVSLPEAISRQATWRRVAQERAYGRALSEHVRRLIPDVVVSSNTPLFAQEYLLRACRGSSIPFLFWQQDIYSEGMRRGAEQRVGKAAGSALGRFFSALEGRQLRRSDGVVVISDDFRSSLKGWRVDDRRVSVIENWAPLPELPQKPRANRWALEHGLERKRVALYSGTLGLKHNPALILDLARSMVREPDLLVVVVSQGSGADWLQEAARAEDLQSLRVFPFQPYELLPDVLASADVLLAVLESGAGRYSVPSKILTYHCAGRPIVAAVPLENLAARTILRAGSGLVADPSDAEGFTDAVIGLLGDADVRERLGVNAYAYANEAFEIGAIADRFESALSNAIGVGCPRFVEAKSARLRSLASEATWRGVVRSSRKTNYPADQRSDL